MSSPRYHMNEDMLDEKERLFEQIKAYRQLGMLKEAVNLSKKLVGLYPDDPETFIELGYNLDKSGEIEKAIKCYQSAIDKFPQYGSIYTNLGYCYDEHMKCYDMAMVCYEKAVELDPDDEWGLNNIGVMFDHWGNRKEALCYYQKACAAEQKKYGFVSFHLLYNLAWGYYVCQDYENASKDFYKLQAATESFPFSEPIDLIAQYWADFGCVKYKMGLYNDALRFFEKANRIQPEKRFYPRLYKLALRKTGKCGGE